MFIYRQSVMELLPSGSSAGAHATVSNLFNLGRHKVCAQHYRDLRISALTEWDSAVA